MNQNLLEIKDKYADLYGHISIKDMEFIYGLGIGNAIRDYIGNGKDGFDNSKTIDQINEIKEFIEIINGIIDVEKCTGCGRCVEACVSKAITLIPEEFPTPQKHDEDVLSMMNTVLSAKAQAECIASALPGKFARALERSNRIMAEDISREAGYMLPQGKNARKFRKNME